jgi:hypothetical protein
MNLISPDSPLSGTGQRNSATPFWHQRRQKRQQPSSGTAEKQIERQTLGPDKERNVIVD